LKALVGAISRVYSRAALCCVTRKDGQLFMIDTTVQKANVSMALVPDAPEVEME
jgi:hypothetical protein